MQEALKKMEDCGAQTILDGTSKAKAEQLMSDEQLEAYKEFLSAKAYQSFALRRRDSKYITATLKESHPPRLPPMTCGAALPVPVNIRRRTSLRRSPRSHPATRENRSGWTAST